MKVGQVVSFYFGKMPKTSDGASIARQRPTNMIDQRKWQNEYAKIEWVDIIAWGSIIDIQNEILVVGDSKYPLEAYRLKKTEVLEVKNENN